jgi:threonine dehydrogenase-like Zn-dependent dehydrogenase
MRTLFRAADGSCGWAEVPEPALDGGADAIVRPLAVAACDLDVGIANGVVPLPGGSAVGHEFVAEVVEVGADVTSVRPGDRVCVPFQASCGACATCRRGRTERCETVPPRSMYGLGALAGWDLGGALADLVRVPYAEAMLLPLPAGVAPATAASASDNMPDAWRTVGPYLHDDLHDRRVLVVGRVSIGLYATAIARALGAAVDYVDADPRQRDTAERLGAVAHESVPPGVKYPITVSTGARVEALVAALRATAPGGVCTDTGIFYGAVELPLLEMYLGGVTLTTGLAPARAVMPQVLALLADGRLPADVVTEHVVEWEDAPAAWQALSGKTVVVRD